MGPISCVQCSSSSRGFPSCSGQTGTRAHRTDASGRAPIRTGTFVHHRISFKYSRSCVASFTPSIDTCASFAANRSTVFLLAANRSGGRIAATRLLSVFVTQDTVCASLCSSSTVSNFFSPNIAMLPKYLPHIAQSVFDSSVHTSRSRFFVLLLCLSIR